MDVRVDSPSGKFYDVSVNGGLCIGLIKVFDEIEDIPCQAWIYDKLQNQIVHSTPHFIGSYLGYTWRKTYTSTP